MTALQLRRRTGEASRPETTSSGDHLRAGAGFCRSCCFGRCRSRACRSSSREATLPMRSFRAAARRRAPVGLTSPTPGSWWWALRPSRLLPAGVPGASSRARRMIRRLAMRGSPQGGTDTLRAPDRDATLSRARPTAGAVGDRAAMIAITETPSSRSPSDACRNPFSARTTTIAARRRLLELIDPSGGNLEAGPSASRAPRHANQRPRRNTAIAREAAPHGNGETLEQSAQRKPSVRRRTRARGCPADPADGTIRHGKCPVASHYAAAAGRENYADQSVENEVKHLENWKLQP